MVRAIALDLRKIAGPAHQDDKLVLVRLRSAMHPHHRWIAGRRLPTILAALSPMNHPVKRSMVADIRHHCTILTCHRQQQSSAVFTDIQPQRHQTRLRHTHLHIANPDPCPPHLDEQVMPYVPRRTTRLRPPTVCILWPISMPTIRRDLMSGTVAHHQLLDTPQHTTR